MTDAVRRYWDSQAGNFDVEADHGLFDPAVRQAWEDLLLPLMPMPGCDVADLGCGTGSLSLLLGEAGHQVWGVDLSEQMVALHCGAGRSVTSAMLLSARPSKALRPLGRARVT